MLQACTRTYLSNTLKEIMLKKFLSSNLVQEIFARFIALYMILVRKTNKWEIIGIENAKEIWNSNSGVVAYYFHSRIFMAHSFWPLDAQEVRMLISLSRDGAFVSRATELLGRGVTRGSTTKNKNDMKKDKGALSAVRQLISFAQNGGAAVITPDGPKGPRMRVAKGSSRIAKAAGVKMFPIAISVNGSKVLNTWDRMLIPPLFSKGVVVYGKPIIVSEDEEADRLELENEMIKITNLADENCNVELVYPPDYEKSETE